MGAQEGLCVRIMGLGVYEWEQCGDVYKVGFASH